MLKPWSMAVCLVIGAGCARYQPRPIEPALTQAAFEGRALNDPGLRAFSTQGSEEFFPEWPPKRWDYPALTMAAFYFNPGLAVARAQRTGGEAALKTAGARPNPTVGVQPGYNFSAASGATPWIPGLTVDWPLETTGKRGYRLAKARFLAEAGRLRLASAAWQARSNVRTALLAYSDGLRQETLLAGHLGIQEQMVALMEQRLSAGTITGSEVSLARLGRERSRAALNEARRVKEEGLAKLADAVGAPRSAFDGLDIQAFAQCPRESGLTTPEARERALRNRPDLLEALAEYAATQAALQLEIARQYPDIHLGTGYQWDQGESKWQLGLTAELPVLNRNQGPIAEAEARRKEAAARFGELQAKAIGEIDRAAAAYRSALANTAALEAMRGDQQALVEATEAQLKAGAADQLELLAARFELVSGEKARWEAEAKALEAWGRLEDAIQPPLVPEKVFGKGLGMMEGKP